MLISMGMVSDEDEDEKRMMVSGMRVIGKGVGECVCCSF